MVVPPPSKQIQPALRLKPISFFLNNCFEARVEKLAGISVSTHQFKYGSAVALEFALPEAADVFEVF
jgi:hypothetical protein